MCTAKQHSFLVIDATKYEFFTGGKIVTSDQRKVIKQANFTYTPLGKALKKQTKTIERHCEKQVKVTDDHGEQLVKYHGFA